MIMKQLKFVLILIAFISVSMTTKLSAADDFVKVATAICEYTKANDRNKIRKKLRRAKMKIRSIYGDIKCNDQTLYNFAVTSNAEDVVKYYETKIKASKL